MTRSTFSPPASAPGEVVMCEYGFTVEDVCRRVGAVRDKKGESER